MQDKKPTPDETILHYAIQQEAYIKETLAKVKAHQDNVMRGIIIGAGNRGHHYAQYLTKHGMTIYAVVDPDDAARTYFAERFDIPVRLRFKDISETIDKLIIEDKIDAAVIATPDGSHLIPSRISLKQGWHILIEKPTTDTIKEYDELISYFNYINALREKQDQYPLIAATCHVLEYSPFYRVLDGIFKYGELGNIYHIKHTEAVGFQHFLSSYIRGPWRDTDETTAKLSHDYSLTHRLVTENHCAQTPVRIKTNAYNNVFNLRHHVETLRQDIKHKSSTNNCDTCSSNKTCPASATEIYGYTKPYPDTLTAIAKQTPTLTHLNKIGEAGGARLSDTSVRHALPFNVLNRTFLQAPTVYEGYHAVIELLQKAVNTNKLNQCAYLETQYPKDTHFSEIVYDNDLTVEIHMLTATNHVSTRSTIIEAENGCAMISQDKDKEQFTIQYFHPTQKGVTSPLSDATSINMNDGHGGADEGICMSFLAAIITQDPSLVQQLESGREAYEIMSYAMTSKSLKQTVYFDKKKGISSDKILRKAQRLHASQS